MFVDEMMGPERMEKRKQVDAVLGGDEADYDRYFRSGSFVSHRSTEDETMPRGNIAQQDASFHGAEPNPGVDFGEGEQPMIQAAGDNAEGRLDTDEMGVRPRDRRIGSTGRPGHASLEPMAFDRRRAGSVAGAMSAPFTPDIYRNREEEVKVDNRAFKHEQAGRNGDALKLRAAFLRSRMQGSSMVLNFGAGHRAPVPTADQEKAEQARQNNGMSYLHAGKALPESAGRDWDTYLWARMDPGNRVSPEHRGDAEEMWEEMQGGTTPPEKGWDKPKVGRFRSAMSWLGNKLTFGMFGGKDYRARQEALAKRRGIVEHAFANRQQYFDEREFDLANPTADEHMKAKEMYGGQHIGRRGVLHSAFTPYDNPRYNDTESWIKKSDYGRAKWDRLAAKSSGSGSVTGLLGR